jgi:hypothetical protein
LESLVSSTDLVALLALWLLPICTWLGFDQAIWTALRTGRAPPDNQRPKMFWTAVVVATSLFSIFLAFALLGTFGFVSKFIS